MISQTWFGVIYNELAMSDIYRRLVDLKGVSYRIVGKIRDDKDQISIIKFLVRFEKEVDFFTIKGGCDRLQDSYNTILPVEINSIQYIIDVIKRTTFLEEGCHPITEKFIDDCERYFSSDDSPYTTHDEMDDEVSSTSTTGSSSDSSPSFYSCSEGEQKE